jgi:hypothetical protein
MLTFPILFALFSMVVGQALECILGRPAEAIPGECWKYKVCEISVIGSLFGSWKEYSCPDAFHFDPTTATCLTTRESTCCKFVLDSINL